MRLPSFRRLFKSDFPKDEQDMIDKLANTINPGIESLYTVLNNNVSLRDNFLCTVKDVIVNIDGTGTTPTNIGMSLNSTNNVDGLLVLLAISLTDGNTYPTGQPFISFTQNGSSLLFNNITNLPANNKWQLRVVAFQR
jgi:hypothetical protein